MNSGELLLEALNFNKSKGGLDGWLEIFKNSKRNLAATFAHLSEEPITNWNAWEGFQIYIQKSQTKTEFLTIISPIFQDLWHFIHLWYQADFLQIFSIFQTIWLGHENLNETYASSWRK